MVISGALEVQSGGTYGYSAGDFEVSSSIGSVDIQSGGNMYASTDLTTVGASSIPAIFNNDGTFYHNSGTVALEYGAGGDSKITGSARTTFNKLNTGFSYMHAGFVVEDTWATTGDGGGATTFYKASQNWVLGTTSNTGYLVTNVGIGVQAGENTTISGASEAYPAIVSGTKYDFHTTINTLNNVDFADAQTSDDNATLVLSNVDFSSGLTTNDGTTQTVTATSGTWVKFGSTFSPGDGTKEIVSGATVIFDGTGNYSQDNAATVYGRGSATLWWDSTGNYSPNGSFTSTGFRDVFWNSSARINQDAVFRGSNLIVGGGFSAQNRAIGTSGSPPKIIIANGGTISSSTNVFHASSFSNRGGLFVSSSALTFDGTDDKVTIDENYDAIGTSNNFTVEGWFKTAVKVNYMHIFSRGSAWGTGNITVYMNSDGYIQASANDLSNTLTASEDLSDGKWHHFAYTYDQTDVKLYIDGALKASAAKTNTLNNVTTKSDIGTRGSAVDTWWNGEIGRVSIWSSALTTLQMKTMMFQDFATATTTNCLSWYQFDAGEGTAIIDSAGTQNGVWNGSWATAGTWTGGNKLGSETGVVAGNIYIGNGGVTPTVFGSSYFPLANRRLVSGSKFASKSHLGTTEYYVATSGTNDWLNYQKLEEVASIGALNDLKVLADGSNRSYFNFDSNANNEQCNTFVNAGYIRIVDNADFYTQDFDNSQGIWERGPSYDGIIHDDGSTPHEYEPIDLMDDQDSNFDTSELID
tara:strand:- start:1150 stop:3405 length:2256 start_codon:yes stop_codon:yes gene_type:complete